MAALSCGKYVIDGERIYVSIQEYETPCGTAALSHIKIWDIQCILQGREQIWVTEQPLPTPDTEYDPEADIRF
ncbi:MAG: YhcH/YjgK/YiaL family protein [Waltera sp.]